MGKYPDSLDKITKARLAFSALGSIVSIALTMFFIGTLIFFIFFSSQYMNNLSKKMEMEILFYSDVKEADIVSLEQKIKLENYVASSRVSSKADNTKEAIHAVGNNYLDIISNPINASIIVSVKPEFATTENLKDISKKIKLNTIVQDVQYPDFIVKSVHNNFMLIQLVTIGICVVFMLISMLLINNSIRLSIYAKRFNIKSMLLVGATRAFIQKPFLFKGFIQGVWGGFIAILLLGLLLYEGNLFFPEFVDFSYINLISLILGSVFLFSILFTVLSTFMSVHKYIRINSDRLYL